MSLATPSILGGVLDSHCSYPYYRHVCRPLLSGGYRTRDLASLTMSLPSGSQVRCPSSFASPDAMASMARLINGAGKKPGRSVAQPVVSNRRRR